MDALKASIERDGFCAPILVRPYDRGRYEIISGNHRYMAARELGIVDIPCVVSNMSDASAQRLAINLNTIHGEPNAEILAPFLADLDISVLSDIHIEDEMKRELLKFDEDLARTLASLDVPQSIDRDSPRGSNTVCECPACGRKHFQREQ